MVLVIAPQRVCVRVGSQNWSPVMLRGRGPGKAVLQCNLCGHRWGTERLHPRSENGSDTKQPLRGFQKGRRWSGAPKLEILKFGQMDPR